MLYDTKAILFFKCKQPKHHIAKSCGTSFLPVQTKFCIDSYENPKRLLYASPETDCRPFLFFSLFLLYRHHQFLCQSIAFYDR